MFADADPVITRALARYVADNDSKRRACSAIWTAMGISMFALLVPLGLSGRADQQVCVAVVMTLLGFANAASGILLKWKAQFACALVWWLASAAALFGTDRKA